jgi:hypothetical protein
MPTLECRNCGAGAPVDEHFCPHAAGSSRSAGTATTSSFFGLPRQLGIDSQGSRAAVPRSEPEVSSDYFYNAPPADRLASLERSSYLNDAYRALETSDLAHRASAGG